MLRKKFGKLAYKADPRTIKLEKYFRTPPPPQKIDWTAMEKLPWGMLGNDKAGNCVVAGALHRRMVWGCNTNRSCSFTEEFALQLYSKLTGYDPVTGANDNGLNMLDFLKFWKNTGLPDPTGTVLDQIGGFAYVNPANVPLVAWTIDFFGGAYTGLALPESIIDPATGEPRTDLWQLTHGHGTKPGSLGGHCVDIPGYDASLQNGQGEFFPITWGGITPMTTGFFTKYADECWAIFSEDWLADSGDAPNGFDKAQLIADLSQVGTIPA